MTNQIKNICVFASSSNYIDNLYFEEAKILGQLIGRNNYNIVYGGSKLGLMFACARAVKESGGKIIGIMPEKIASFGCSNPEDCDEFILTKGMRERKAKLDELSDAVIALPGGYGTLEELSEIIVQKQLGYSNKPIVILNIANFYDSIINFFEETIEKGFANKNSRKLYYVASNSKEAIEYIKSYKAEIIDSKFAKT